ncbi:MAG: hypothetical protein JWL76_2371 [Thermoleophilia bacterium]|nr:hypothetical protein [Thermoleophilia bacterium]
MNRTWNGTGEDPDNEGATLTAHDEELIVDKREFVSGSVTARKRVESERYQDVVSREVEYGDTEIAAPLEGDSGEILTLEDGSISIPLFEERIVVRKELVVRERVVIRKRVTTEEHRIDATLKSEHIQIEGDVEDVTP